MLTLELLKPFVISLLLGALVGMERAFASRFEKEGQDILAGVRTFTLIALMGCLSAFLDARVKPGILLTAFGGILLITTVSYFISYFKHAERGLTTEISIFICFLIGVLAQTNHIFLSVFTAVILAIILHLKESVNRLTARIESEDIRALLKFAIITFVILPLFDPSYSLRVRDTVLAEQLVSLGKPLADLELINPHTVWLMVVLISGIGFTGYVSIKALGSRKGIGLTGFLGGLVSSTATTMTFSRRSREAEALSLSFALAVLLACSTMFPRILVEVSIINPALLQSLVVTMGLMALGGFAFSFLLWKKSGNESGGEVPLKNPFLILPALKFGMLYAGIVLLTRVMEVIGGNSGVYIVSILSGATDVDAITLTMSQISRQDPSKMGQATTAITLAAFSNTLMKAGMAFFMGSSTLRKLILIGFGIILLSGIIGLVLLNI